MPRVSESLEAMSGAKVFSTIDLASAYHQVEVEEQDKPKTAFTTPFGLYEWNRMPFRLANAPATFMRLMTNIFRDDLLYLDDIIIFSPDLDSHLVRLDLVLDKLNQHGLKVEAKKYCLFRKRVRFLGHIIFDQGIHTDPEKISAVAGWLRPDSLKELRWFLGFCSYYRRFARWYASIVAPLHKLVGQLAANNSGSIGNLWKSEHVETFGHLKSALTSASILLFVDFNQPFILETDASHQWLGSHFKAETGWGHESYCLRKSGPP